MIDRRAASPAVHLAALLAALTAAGCSAAGDSPDGGTRDAPDARDASGDGDATGGPGTFLLRTDEYVVPATAERYLCYARTLDEDLDIEAISYQRQDTVHHM